ncbi:hypothetical protein EDB80DRAFT_595408, partial [Ilyonectria destructans]
PSTALYVILTLESTGQPKGVIMDHAAFSSNLVASSKHLHLDHNSHVFKFSSHTWSIFIEDFPFTLVAGGCIYIPFNGDRMSTLAASFTTLRANWMAASATVTRTLDLADIPTMKTLVVGGEALLKSDVEKWAAALNLINIFGVSECGIVTIRQY